MDVVKLKGCTQKVPIGDCVRVPGDYFGKPFQKTLRDLGFTERVYGRVVEGLVESHHFSIKWDLNEQITHDHQLETVKLENADTPFQYSVATPPGTAPVPIHDQQMSSTVAMKTHAIIEDAVEPSSVKYFLTVDGDEEELVMKATMDKPWSTCPQCTSP